MPLLTLVVVLVLVSEMGLWVSAAPTIIGFAGIVQVVLVLTARLLLFTFATGWFGQRFVVIVLVFPSAEMDSVQECDEPS